MTAWLNSIWYGAPDHRHGLPVLSLGLVAMLYRCLVAVRRFLYARGIKRQVHLAVPVIVVGNLSVGGTGKTPLLIWLAAMLVDKGYLPGIVTRGYGGLSRQWPQSVGPNSDPREVGDEAVLLSSRTSCPVVAGPGRVAAARRLLSDSAVDVILSDDGLQHYRLGRTIELAVVDGVRAFGNGHCLPAGPLREPLGRLRDVDAIVINGGAPLDPLPAGIVRSGKCIVRGAMRAIRVCRVDGTGSPRQLADFSGRSVRALAGIGHPERFFSTLEQAGIRVVPCPLPDHAELTAQDFEDQSLPVLMTEKDAVKCRDIAAGDVWYVAAEMNFGDDAAQRLSNCVLDRLGVVARTPCD